MWSGSAPLSGAPTPSCASRSTCRDHVCDAVGRQGGLQSVELLPHRVRGYRTSPRFPREQRCVIATGALPAVRVGDRWVIEDGVPLRRREGRPWSEAAAWGLLWMAVGRPAPWLSVKQRQRVRMRMVEGVPAHVDRLSALAKPLWFRAHPSALPRLVSDSRLVDSGLSAASVVGADLVVARIDSREGVCGRR